MFEIVARELRAKLLGRRRGQGGLRDDALSHTQQHSTAGVEGAGGTGGPGRGAGGWRQGQGGPRDRPLRAQLACGDLAGGPPPTGTHSGRAPQSSPAPRGARNTRGATSNTITRAGRRPPAHTAAGLSGARNTRGGHKPQPGKTKTADPEGSTVSSCARGELNPHSITGTRT